MDQRQRGHRFERKLVNWFKDLGFKYAKTTREASRLLDNTGIDLWGVPILTQAKYGKHKGMKYSKLIRETKNNLKKNFGEDSLINELPYAIFHTTNARKEENQLVVISFKDFEKLMKQIYDNSYREQNKDLYSTVFQIGSSDTDNTGSV